MPKESVAPATHSWQLPEILFVVAACFAMGAVGFFVAVFLSSSAQPTKTKAVTPEAQTEAKLQIMEQPVDRGDGKGPIAPVKVRNQFDDKDPNGEAKLKMMQQSIER